MATTLLIMSFCLWTFLLAIAQLHQIRSRREWRALWRRLGMPTIEDQKEIALRDFIIAYDNQVPLQLLAAYDEAVEIIESIS
ncbi:MAG: hypothetical protein KAS19_01295 [Anaerolineales bacterium]|nr:hypothetical protein [Anaerolineales bacterium]